MVYDIKKGAIISSLFYIYTFDESPQAQKFTAALPSDIALSSSESFPS